MENKVMSLTQEQINDVDLLLEDEQEIIELLRAKMVSIAAASIILTNAQHQVMKIFHERRKALTENSVFE